MVDCVTGDRKCGPLLAQLKASETGSAPAQLRALF